MTLYEQALARVEKRWGNGWNLLNDELRRGLSAAELLDTLNGIAPCVSHTTFGEVTRASIREWLLNLTTQGE